MGQITVSGQIQGGPPTSTGPLFPGSHIHAPLSTLQTPKLYGVATGVLTQQLNSPAAFVPLNGVAPDAAVTQGDFLYLKCDSPIQLRMTHDDGGGGQTVVVVPVHGVFVMEFPTLQPLEVLEAQGSATIEYLVSGQS